MYTKLTEGRSIASLAESSMSNTTRVLLTAWLDIIAGNVEQAFSAVSDFFSSNTKALTGIASSPFNADTMFSCDDRPLLS